VDDIGKFDGILDKENRNIIPNQVPIAFLRVELDCESAHVAREIGTALIARYGRKPDENGVRSPAL